MSKYIYHVKKMQEALEILKVLKDDFKDTQSFKFGRSETISLGQLCIDTKLSLDFLIHEYLKNFDDTIPTDI